MDGRAFVLILEDSNLVQKLKFLVTQRKQAVFSCVPTHLNIPEGTPWHESAQLLLSCFSDHSPNGSEGMRGDTLKKIRT